MDEVDSSDAHVRRLEVRRIESEIRKNEAQALESEHRHKGWWRLTVIGILVFLAMLGSFASFFSDFYQVAVVDRNRLRDENARFERTNTELESKNRTHTQSIAALSSARFSDSNVNAPNLSDLPNAVVVMRWGPRLREVLAIQLAPDGYGAGGTPLSHGAALGVQSLDVETGKGPSGGQNWSGHWSLRDDTLRITEVFPRGGQRGFTIEVLLSRASPTAQHHATRSVGSSTEHGVAEVLLAVQK